MATQGSEQPDLFESAPLQTQAALAPLRRTSVLEQLQALLIEATEIRESAMEAGDDQDQA